MSKAIILVTRSINDQNFSPLTSPRLTLSLPPGHPFDTLKVLLQTGRHRSLGDAFRATVREHGPGGLYKGVASPLVGMGVFNAVQFAVFAGVKSAFTDGGRTTTLNRIAAAAGLTGIFVAFVEGPQDLFKCQMQAQMGAGSGAGAGVGAGAGAGAGVSAGASAGVGAGASGVSGSVSGAASGAVRGSTQVRYAGTLDCARTIIRERGLLAGPFQGIGVTIARNVVGVTAYFYFYEGARIAMAGPDRPPTSISFLQTMLAGGIGGVGYWALCYPLDIVKTAVQCDSIHPAQRRYAGALDAAAQLWKEGGARRFTAGLSPALLRSFPANAVGFAVYESTKEMVEKRVR